MMMDPPARPLVTGQQPDQLVPILVQGAADIVFDCLVELHVGLSGVARVDIVNRYRI